MQLTNTHPGLQIAAPKGRVEGYIEVHLLRNRTHFKLITLYNSFGSNASVARFHIRSRLPPISSVIDNCVQIPAFGNSMSNTRKRTLAHLRLSTPAQTEFDYSTPRSGKWSPEEEAFAKKLIVQFEAGTLEDCEEGATLRSYLSKRLRCAPMRISKKFAGQCIGKHTFVKKVNVGSSTDQESAPLNMSVSVEADDASAGTTAFVPTTMSFDTFTYYQMCQSEACDAADATVLNTGIFIPAEIQVPPAGVHVITDRTPIFADATHCTYSRARAVSDSEPSVGLDLDELFTGAGRPVIPEASADSSLSSSVCTDRETPVPGPAGPLLSGAHPVSYNTPMPASYGRPTEPAMTVQGPGRTAYPLPVTPTAVVRSGAALFSPMAQLSPVMDYKPVDPEAAEWHDVLAYFCNQPMQPSTCLPAEPQAVGAQLLHQELRHSGSYSSLLL